MNNIMINDEVFMRFKKIREEEAAKWSIKKNVNGHFVSTYKASSLQISPKEWVLGTDQFRAFEMYVNQILDTITIRASKEMQLNEMD